MALDQMTTAPQPTDQLSATAIDPSEGERVRADDRAHVFHSWSAQNGVDLLPIAGAAGRYFWDYSGKRYLDFASQMVNLNIGHGHPKVVAAIREQADRLCMVGPTFANDKRGEAASLLAALAPGDLNKVFFTSGGTEANEHAVRMARLATGRHKVLSAYRSYHGGTGLSMHLTGDPRRWPNDTGAAGVVHFSPPYLYRSAFGATTDEEECRRALDHVEHVISFEGPNTIAAILIEPIIGTGGILVPPDGYLQGLRRLCDRYGVVLIADEVMTGFGRTGAWFAVNHWEVEPDLLTFAKGVNSGYVPLGGVLISDRIADVFADRAYPGGLTYSGHPLATAAAVAALTAMKEEDMVGHAAWLGDHVLGPGLREVAERHPSVGEVRGIGVFWAMELVRNRVTREMLVPYAAVGEQNRPVNEVVAACKENGMWPLSNYNRIHLVPPCNITEEEARQGIAILDDALSAADRYVSLDHGRLLLTVAPVDRAPDRDPWT